MRKSSRFAFYGIVCLAALGMMLVGLGLAEGDGLIIASPQLVTSVALSQTSTFIYQYPFVDGYPTPPWISGDVLAGAVGDVYGLTGSGDIDNDGADEVYAVNNLWVKNVKIDKKTSYSLYTQRLTIYRSGSLPGMNPSATINDIRGSGPDGARSRANDCIVANVDADSYQELVVQHGSGLGVYQIVNGVLTKEWETPDTFEHTLNGLAVGNLDDDGNQEIVAGNLMEGAPVIFKFNGTGFGYRLGELCTIFAKGTQGTNVIDPRLGDLDNDGRDEIVAGGRNYRVMLWDYDGEEYKLIFTGPSLGYLTSANIGDVDGDSGNEIIACNMGNMGKPPYLWIFDGPNFALRSKTQIAYSGSAGVEIGDLDSDGREEVIVPLAGLIKFYRFVGDNLTTGFFSEYASVTGSLCEIR